MKRNLSDKVSYFMKPDGTIRQVMPDQDPTFSPQQLHGFIGEQIEMACRTREGYVLLCTKEGSRQGLEMNQAATEVCEEVLGPGHVILGNALLAHPEHVC
jgi:hypothetical protein